MKNIHYKTYEYNNVREDKEENELPRYNIKEYFGDFIDEFKSKYLKNDGTIKSKGIFISKIFEKYPNFKDKLQETYGEDFVREVMYCILKDIDTIPLCPICNNYNYLRDYVSGFQGFCSTRCRDRFLKNDEEFANKIKTTNLEKYHCVIPELDSLGYEYYRKNNNAVYTIKNFCKHGDLDITYPQLNRHKVTDFKYACIECNKELYDYYNPSDDEISSFQKQFKSFHKKNSQAYNSDWWMRYHPKEKKIIDVYASRIDGVTTETTDAEKYYLFLNNMTEIPRCPHKNCNNYSVYSGSTSEGYRTYCSIHSNCAHQTSRFEKDVKEYIEALGFEIDENNCSIFDTSTNRDRREIDIIVPSLNIGIECNGSFYHKASEKTITYHKDKRVDAQLQQNIRLYSLWDDSWSNRQDVCKHHIKEWLKLNPSLDITSVEVKPIDQNIFMGFLDTNAMYVPPTLPSNEFYGMFSDTILIAVVSVVRSENRNALTHFTCLINYHIDQQRVIEKFLDYISSDGDVFRFSIDLDYQDALSATSNITMVKDDIDYMIFRSGSRYDKFDSNVQNIESERCYNSGIIIYEYKKVK